MDKKKSWNEWMEEHHVCVAGIVEVVNRLSIQMDDIGGRFGKVVAYLWWKL